MAGKLSAFFGAQDMTVGNPATNLIRFSTPLLIGNLAQQLYSTVDSIVVGNYVGDSALAAIGAAAPSLTCCSYCSWAYRSVPASWRRSISVRKTKSDFRIL